MDSDLRSIADARECARRSRAAFEQYRRFDQASVDRITHAVVEAGHHESERLARMAVKETGIGNVPGKTAKNRFATRGLWESIGSMKTCGIVREDAGRGIWEVADPFGVVAAIIPTTNPTSTALFKALCCLKSRNGMVASPHPRATECIRESVRICHDAAVAAGAPRDLLMCMSAVSLEGTQELMHGKDIDLILATGGSALVRAAYSSGKPAFGVGPGNTPVFIDQSADVNHAARCITESLGFDFGTICSSEQALICDRPVAGSFRQALTDHGVHWCSAEERAKLEAIALRGKIMNPDIVGLSPQRVAQMAGFEVSAETTVLVAPHDRHEVGPGFPLSYEQLCPLVAYYEVDGFEDGCHLCLEILNLGGRGHTLGLHCENEAVIRAFAEEKPVNRLVVNSPTTQGAVGLTTQLFPSMTLGCGSFGGNITSDNIGPQHLLNIKRVAFARPAYRDGTFEARWEAKPPAGGGAATRSTWDPDALEAGPARPGAPRIPNPGTVSRRTAPGGDSVMGVSKSPLPGEHFSEQDLERIVRDALRKRRPEGQGH